jgi:hypothetical protein
VGAALVPTSVPAIHPRQLAGGVGDQQELLRRLPNFDLHEVLARPEIRSRVHWHFYGRLQLQVIPPPARPPLAAFVGDDAVSSDVVSDELLKALQLRLFRPRQLSNEQRIVPVYQLQPYRICVGEKEAMKIKTDRKEEDDEERDWPPLHHRKSSVKKRGKRRGKGREEEGKGSPATYISRERERGAPLMWIWGYIYIIFVVLIVTCTSFFYQMCCQRHTMIQRIRKEGGVERKYTINRLGVLIKLNIIDP